jgi:hypothetical protein
MEGGSLRSKLKYLNDALLNKDVQKQTVKMYMYVWFYVSDMLYVDINAELPAPPSLLLSDYSAKLSYNRFKLQLMCVCFSEVMCVKDEVMCVKDTVSCIFHFLRNKTHP